MVKAMRGAVSVVEEAAQEVESALDEEGLIGDVLVRKLEQRGQPVQFRLWVVGDSPLIVHAWSAKAKHEMLSKQMKATTDSKPIRDPKQDFMDSVYKMTDGSYGFPLMAFKKSILGAAHKDKGIAKTVVQAALRLEGEWVRAYTAFSDAICDMPVVRIYGSEPEMREDMVRVGAGMNKTASLAYRAQFKYWAVNLRGRVNPKIIPLAALSFLINEAGYTTGVGDWRNEKDGLFGAFHLAGSDESKEWDAFAKGRGTLPQYDQQTKQAA